MLSLLLTLYSSTEPGQRCFDIILRAYHFTVGFPGTIYIDKTSCTGPAVCPLSSSTITPQANPFQRNVVKQRHAARRLEIVAQTGSTTGEGLGLWGDQPLCITRQRPTVISRGVVIYWAPASSPVRVSKTRTTE